MNLDGYYRGLAGSAIQELSDRLLELSGEAAAAEAHDAAFHLAETATELLDMGLELGGQHTPPVGEPL
jgi:hypothetical protein